MAWQIFKGDRTDQGMVYTGVNAAYSNYEDACKVASTLVSDPDDIYLVKKIDGRKFRGAVVGSLKRVRDLTEDSQVS